MKDCEAVFWRRQCGGLLRLKAFLFAAAFLGLMFFHIFDCTLSSFYIALFFQNIFSLMPFMFYVIHFAYFPCCHKNKLASEDGVVEGWKCS